jgi:hypothetical protein
MASRPTRNRRDFRLESLEVRDAPAHFGGMAHAAVALKVHAPAHVGHISAPHISAPHISAPHVSASNVSAKPHAVGNGSGAEQGAEDGVGTASNDPDNIQLNQNDQSGVDATGEN